MLFWCWLGSLFSNLQYAERQICNLSHSLSMGYFSVLFKYCIDIYESSCRTPLTNRLLSVPSILLIRLSPFPDPLSLPAISCSLGVLLRLVGFLASLCLYDQLNRLHLLLHISLLNYKCIFSIVIKQSNPSFDRNSVLKSFEGRLRMYSDISAMCPVPISATLSQSRPCLLIKRFPIFLLL